MKKLALVALLLFTSLSVQQTRDAYAGGGEAILFIAAIGGAAYAGYHFNEHYEIKKKAALNIMGGKISLQKPSLQYEMREKSQLSEKKELYSLALLNLDF